MEPTPILALPKTPSQPRTTEISIIASATVHLSLEAAWTTYKQEAQKKLKNHHTPAHHLEHSIQIEINFRHDIWAKKSKFLAAHKVENNQDIKRQVLEKRKIKNSLRLQLLACKHRKTEIRDKICSMKSASVKIQNTDYNKLILLQISTRT